MTWSWAPLMGSYTETRQWPPLLSLCWKSRSFPVALSAPLGICAPLTRNCHKLYHFFPKSISGLNHKNSQLSLGFLQFWTPILWSQACPIFRKYTLMAGLIEGSWEKNVCFRTLPLKSGLAGDPPDWIFDLLTNHLHFWPIKESSKKPMFELLQLLFKLLRRPLI